jgi:multiple sugar transport system substrate-binding protein
MDENQNSPNTYTIPASIQNPAPSVTPPQNATGVSPVVPPPAKKPFPKTVIFAAVGVVILVLILVVVKILTSSSKPSGSAGTITWWGLWENQSTVQPLIDEYQSQHPGIKINYIEQSPQDYRERLTSSLAKGDGPDIFTFHNSWVPMFEGSLDSLPPNVMNPADFAKTFYPVASSDLTSGSSIVGIPLEYDALTLFINQDIFDQAGVTPPTTWDDFKATACKLTVKNDQGVITQAGAAMGRTENVDNWPEILALLMLQNNTDLSNPTGNLAEGALTFFTSFSQNSACPDGQNVWDATLPPSTQDFAAGNLAMYIGPSWRAFDIQAQNPNLKFKTVPIPQLPKDNPQSPDVTYATYWVQGVWSGSSHKAVAWDFLKFLSTQDSLTKLFQNESKVRSFGEPYPRVDMASLLTDHPIAGSIITQAPGAESWYLDSRTFDGPTGINSQMINYFGDAVNAVANGTSTPTQALATCAQGVQQVLAQYKLIAR